MEPSKNKTRQTPKKPKGGKRTDPEHRRYIRELKDYIRDLYWQIASLGVQIESRKKLNRIDAKQLQLARRRYEKAMKQLREYQ